MSRKKPYPQTETEAEELYQRNELLSERIAARMDRDGAMVDLATILDEEIARLRRERGEPDFPRERGAGDASGPPEILPFTEEPQVDAEADDELDREHPLAKQAIDLALKLAAAAEDDGWFPQDVSEEHPVAELVNGTMKAGAKLANTLNGREWPPEADCCAAIIVRLKRVCVYLEDAARGADACSEDRLLEIMWLGEATAELRAMAAATEEIIRELRAQLARACG